MKDCISDVQGNGGGGGPSRTGTRPASPILPPRHERVVELGRVVARLQRRVALLERGRMVAVMKVSGAKAGPGPAQAQATVRRIQCLVAGFYGLPAEAMVSRCREAAAAQPRQLAMFLARRLTALPVDLIGQEFGGRDHGTVSFALKAVAARCETEPAWAADRDVLLARAKASADPLSGGSTDERRLERI